LAWLVVSVALQITAAKTLGTVKRINETNKQSIAKKSNKIPYLYLFYLYLFFQKVFQSSNTFFKIQGFKKCKKKLKVIPRFGAHLKYWTFPTLPLFFPSGSSSSMPAHWPLANSVVPQNLNVPT